MKARFSSLLFLLALTGLTADQLPAQLLPEDERAKRPYEMEWAGRTQDEHTPLIDFESETRWKVEGVEGTGALTTSNERPIWGKSVGKLTYRATGDNLRLRVLLEQPVKFDKGFDTLTCWVFGNKFDYEKSDNTSTPTLTAIFADSAGQEVELPLRTIDWSEWFLLHRSLDAAMVKRFAGGGTFKGFTLSGGSNKTERALYIDNLTVFTDPKTPLTFAPRPKRNIEPFAGQTTGTNNGPGQLTFPTRPLTILPDNLDKNAKVTVAKQGSAFVWTYTGTDGRLVYRLDPKIGNFSDISLNWTPQGVTASGTIQPNVGGGVHLLRDGKAVAPEKIEILGSELQNGVVTMRCRLTAGTVTQNVTYRFSVVDKSMMIDVLAPGGNVAEVRYGKAVGLINPRLQTNPYYLYDRSQRPAVVVSGPAEKPFFLTGNSDWYRSNGTQLWAENNDDPNGVVYNGGSRYIPKTDGKRNDCFERFIITASPRYEEVLPNIPNPKSPYMDVTGTRIWRTFGSGVRQNDIAYWEDIHRYGMTEIVINNHETLWRDGQESFTFRTKPAPNKGGDAGEVNFSKTMREKLGYVYGPYNNYTDIQPTNEFWKIDLANRTADNQFQWSWYRSYAPKPSLAVEYAAKIPFTLKEKFGYNTAYCDVHTAVAPWHRVDYDPRVPGGGTFAATFYAYGEILQLQKKAWQGPVYSEGGFHAFYSGLTDGNYAQDPSADLPNKPWLVDFDLRKMHPLSTNFGMGSPDMFDNSPWPTEQKAKDARLDRFLAATIAFGHTGFLDYGIPSSLRSYYMIQQLQSKYAMSNAAEIRYADENGRLWETSDAVARGVIKRSQVVTRYENGTMTAVNGSRTEPMSVTAYGRRLSLAPNGYAGWTPDNAVSVLSNEIKGQRSDYAATPAYIYVDGRGSFTRYNKGASKGIGICRILPNNQFEIIPFEGSECGFAISATSAVALDKAGKELGAATLRVSRGLTYVESVAGAFSYRLTGATAKDEGLKATRDRVVAGEAVTVQGKAAHNFVVPVNAKIGERIWQKFENQWIDFTVVTPVVTQIALKENKLQLTLTSNLATATDVRIGATSEGTVLTGALAERVVKLEPTGSTTVDLDLGEPGQVGEGTLLLSLNSGQNTQRFKVALGAAEEKVALVEFPEKGRPGITLTGQPDSSDLGTSGASVEQRSVTSGKVGKPATFMHPPWQNVTGVTFARYDNIVLPERPAVLRAVVGKADGSYAGNGIIYRIAVIGADNKQTIVGETKVTEHAWKPIEGDLTPWAGQTVAIKLIADPDNDTSGDWGAWAEMRINSRQTRLGRSLKSVSEE